MSGGMLPQFSLPRDRKNDESSRNCADTYTGGWWYSSNCGLTHLTGQHTKSRRKLRGDKQIVYFHGGKRGSTTTDSWKEAEMMLVCAS